MRAARTKYPQTVQIPFRESLRRKPAVRRFWSWLTAGGLVTMLFALIAVAQLATGHLWYAVNAAIYAVCGVAYAGINVSRWQQGFNAGRRETFAFVREDHTELEVLEFQFGSALEPHNRFLPGLDPIMADLPDTFDGGK